MFRRPTAELKSLGEFSLAAGRGAWVCESGSAVPCGRKAANQNLNTRLNEMRMRRYGTLDQLSLAMASSKQNSKNLQRAMLQHERGNE
jgi:predicted RNA-binding protein YlxR (DUF448 family)